MSVCSSCGQEIRDDWKFCRYCGNRSRSHWSFGDLISNVAERSDDILTNKEQLVDTGFIVRLSLQDGWMEDGGGPPLSLSPVSYTHLTLPTNREV